MLPEHRGQQRKDLCLFLRSTTAYMHRHIKCYTEHLGPTNHTRSPTDLACRQRLLIKLANSVSFPQNSASLRGDPRTYSQRSEGFI